MDARRRPSFAHIIYVPGLRSRKMYTRNVWAERGNDIAEYSAMSLPGRIFFLGAVEQLYRMRF